MKTRIETKRYMPGVGETWKHRVADSVFIRLPDDTGAKMIPERPVGDYFFSAHTKDGSVVFTRRDADDLVPAVPSGVKDGKPMFTEKAGKPERVPDVGGYFHVPGRAGDVFLRIPDADGRRALGIERDNGYFYAVNVGNGSACCMANSIVQYGCRALRAVSVDNDGTVVFTEA